MDLTTLVLDLVTEDFAGLWEIVWRAHSAESASTERIGADALRLEVQKLAEAGYIEIFRGIRFDGDESRVPSADVRIILNDNANWQPADQTKEHYRIAATAEGEAEYKRRFGST